MNSLITKIKTIFQQKRFDILLIGGSGVGKTIFLNRLKNKDELTSPTLGFKTETLNFEGFEFNFWEIGGANKIRPLMHHFTHDTDMIVFIFDSMDPESLYILPNYLNDIRKNLPKPSCPLFLIGNNCDKPAVGCIRFAKKLAKLLNSDLVFISAQNNIGVNEAFQKIATNLIYKNAIYRKTGFNWEIKTTPLYGYKKLIKNCISLNQEIVNYYVTTETTSLNEFQNKLDILKSQTEYLSNSKEIFPNPEKTFFW